MRQKEIVFIYSTNVKQIGTPADVAGIPLCKPGDIQQRVIAYAGVLWECQIALLNNPEADKVKIKNKNVYIALSEPLLSEEIDAWLLEKKYARVVSNEENIDIEDIIDK